MRGFGKRKIFRQKALWGPSGVTFGHFGLAFIWLGVHEGYLGVTMVQFRKTLIFPIDFNDFMYLRGQLGVTLGSIFMKIMEDNGRKVKNGPPKRHIDVEWHL